MRLIIRIKKSYRFQVKSFRIVVQSDNLYKKAVILYKGGQKLRDDLGIVDIQGRMRTMSRNPEAATPPSP